MTRAFVELIGSASYTVNKRKFIKNSPQILTDPTEIRFFQNRHGFRVTIVDDSPKTAETKKVEIKNIEIKNLDKELEKIVEKPKKKEKKAGPESESKPEPKPEPKPEKKPKYKKEDLLALRKVELSALAEKMGIVFDAPTKRLKMISRILAEQEG